jgi:hypothetical protein
MMTKIQKPSAQLERFKAAAREIGADDDEARFNDVLRRVGKAPPPADKPKKPEPD